MSEIKLYFNVNQTIKFTLCSKLMNLVGTFLQRCVLNWSIADLVNTFVVKYRKLNNFNRPTVLTLSYDSYLFQRNRWKPKKTHSLLFIDAKCWHCKFDFDEFMKIALYFRESGTVSDYRLQNIKNFNQNLF